MTINISLFGGSGTLGFETFKILWQRRDEYRIKLLLRDKKRNRKLFRRFLKEAEPGQLKIIWGDVIEYPDVQSVIKNADYVLDAMAVISPKADYYPELSKQVNTEGIANIVRAIGDEPGGNSRIKLAYTGTVAQTGDRRPPIHWGRVGDPLKPSLFDYYAVTKIAGERIVIESDIQHWVSLRLTGIMPSDYKGFLDRRDPLGFHMPLNTCLENVTARDAGLGLANVVQIPDSSDFWRGIYNMGGGPGMRIPSWTYIQKIYELFGIPDFTMAVERKWFAIQNFHMQYYVDSECLNDYLHYWRDDTDSWLETISATFPAHLKLLRWLARIVPGVSRWIANFTHSFNRRLLENHRNGTLHWRQNDNDKRLDAFFGGREAFDSIPGWDKQLPKLHDGQEQPTLLDHGYDEQKSRLELTDLEGAARFRGGRCTSSSWDQDLFSPVDWQCGFGHSFTAKPNTILRGGHWCPECEPPDWNYLEQAARNPFFNQVVEPFKESIPAYPITFKDLDDVRAADKDD